MTEIIVCVWALYHHYYTLAAAMSFVAVLHFYIAMVVASE